MRVDVKRVLKNYGILFAFRPRLRHPGLAVAGVPEVEQHPERHPAELDLRDMAVGMTFVILTGGIDLSVGSILAVAGALAAGMLKAGAALPWVVLVALAVGATIGLANGLIITVGRITPFVATLGMMSMRPQPHPHLLPRLSLSGFNPHFRYIGGGDLLGIPFPIVVFLLTVILAA